MDVKRDPADWSEADLEQCMATMHGLTLAQLEQFELPAPDYVAGGQRHWVNEAVVAWLNAFHTAYWASHPQEHAAMVELLTSAPELPEDDDLW